MKIPYITINIQYRAISFLIPEEFCLFEPLWIDILDRVRDDFINYPTTEQTRAIIQSYIETHIKKAISSGSLFKTGSKWTYTVSRALTKYDIKYLYTFSKQE